MKTENELSLYLEEHPIYEKIRFKNSDSECDAPLTPIHIMSQAIIDAFIEKGDNRISLIMPDDNLNVLPLIISKYFSNLQDDIDYSQNIFDEIESGQHVMVGKAVIEFDSIDYEKGTIITIAGKERTKETNKLKDYFFHLYFEKTNKSLTKYNIWGDEKAAIRKRIKEYGISDIQKLKLKRTFLNKTVVVIAPKNKTRDYLDDLYIGGEKFSDVVSYGELDLKGLKNGEKPYRLYNKGKLDCLPAIIITSKLSDLNAALRIPEFKEKVATIVSTQEKLDEIMDNMDALIKCLKTDIPFISFLPERSFEAFPQLSDLGFEFWHWKPSTINSYDFDLSGLSREKSLFSDFSLRVKNASQAQYSVIKLPYDLLKQTKLLIKQLSQLLLDADRDFKQITYKMNYIHKLISSTVAPASKELINEQNRILDQISDIWNNNKKYYVGQPVEKCVESIIDALYSLLLEPTSPKENALSDFIGNAGENFDTSMVVIPDGYLGFESLVESINSIRGNGRVYVLKLSEFYEFTSSHSIYVDNLVITWFDKNEYIKIKQTYCYKKLTYILYDYENSWRSGYVRRFDSCLPHERLIVAAKKIGLKSHGISAKPADQVEDVPYSDIGDYNFDRDLFANAIGSAGKSYESSDSVEVVPILFKTNEIGFFTPNHKMIDITDLCSGENDYPVYKMASRVSKDNIIIIRESNKDIISEIADEMMQKNGVLELRAKAEKWVLLLQEYAEGKSIHFILNVMEKYGVECSEQQLRNWLLGETICPSDIKYLVALGEMSNNDEFLHSVEDIFNAGRTVRKYHQVAGKELTKQLKARANELRIAAQNGMLSSNIEGIGKIKILTVEEVFDMEITNRARVNRLEELS